MPADRSEIQDHPAARPAHRRHRRLRGEEQVDRVQTIVTPGNTIDVLVTDLGIAVNPIRTDLL
ncbi:MAG: citrate lyase subunit alpha, partial [Sweet potato little leaf phytoplasma]|nr:citrate lyase subunit alpha [Sweet potato little leaf phytoplasma]